MLTSIFYRQYLSQVMSMLAHFRINKFHFSLKTFDKFHKMPPRW